MVTGQGWSWGQMSGAERSLLVACAAVHAGTVTTALAVLW